MSNDNFKCSHADYGFVIIWHLCAVWLGNISQLTLASHLSNGQRQFVMAFFYFSAITFCSRLIKTDMELEVLRYTNRASSEGHKMVPTLRYDDPTWLTLLRRSSVSDVCYDLCHCFRLIVILKQMKSNAFTQIIKCEYKLKSIQAEVCMVNAIELF